LGMLRSVKALVAWGEINPEILGHVLVKRGERNGADGLDDSFVRLLGRTSFEDLAKAVVAGEVGIRALYWSGLKPRFSLHPPRGGFKRSLIREIGRGSCR